MHLQFLFLLIACFNSACSQETGKIHYKLNRTSWNRKMHGNGTMTNQTGAFNIGQFKNNEREGDGTFVNRKTNKTLYTGSFLNNKWDGKVKAYLPSGIYEGEWANGTFHGNGTFSFHF